MKNRDRILALAACGSRRSVGRRRVLRHPSPAARPLAPAASTVFAEKLLCGTYSVWENRATRRAARSTSHRVGPELAADAARIRCSTSRAAGRLGRAARRAAGPPAVRCAPIATSCWSIQRGTGKSHRLDCKGRRTRGGTKAYFEPSLPPADVRPAAGRARGQPDLTSTPHRYAADASTRPRLAAATTRST